MLEKMVIKDFQCHRRLEIVFDERLTTIVGRSDAGKSAILRAARWLAVNRPCGDAFVRRGAERALVRLSVDGRTILRRKGADRNLYVLDGQVLASFGQDIPSPVGDLLNLGEVNFQRQHDAPFWFLLSPGEVSRELNQIVNLGLIDRTLALAAADLRQNKAELKVTEDRLADCRKRKQELVWVEEADRELKSLEESERHQEEMRKRCTDLEKAIAEVKRCERMIRVAKRLGPYGRAVEKVAERLKRLIADSGSLSELVNRYRATEKQLCQLEKDAARKAEELKRLTKGRCPLCGSPVRL